jgi:5-methyltetrahydropteroyltriglutamate--homocysteine methyltransferase
VPEGKIVVLGLLTTKAARLESVPEIMRRIDEASRYVPLERLCLSPQCGFASTVDGNQITEADQWAKLERTLEVTRRVWGAVAG